MQNKIFQIVTDQIIIELQKGNIPWYRPWSVVHHQNINGREYTGINRLLFRLSNYPYPYFMTMKQVNERGGLVKKGAKAHLAVFWKILEVKETLGEIEKVKKIPCLRYYSVFNIEQTTLPRGKRVTRGCK